MAIFFKTLHDMGILSVGVLCFVIFVMECIAVTTSWHVTELTTCTQKLDSEIDANTNATIWVPTNTTASDRPDHKLFLQPRMGMCEVSSDINVKDDDCYMWDDSNFWETWGKTVSAGDDALYDSANLMPNVYYILVAATVLSMVSWVLITVHYFKPEYVSRWICQLYVALVAVVSIICFLYTTIGSTASVLVNADKWNQYYYKTEGWSCSGLAEEPYIGVGFTAVALSINVIVYFIVAFPTCFGRCFLCVGDGPSDFDIANKIVEDNRKEAQSDYVPPHV